MSDITHETPTVEAAPPRRLVRVNEGRWLGGVAAGLGRYFDVNPLVYRIAFAVLALAGGTGLLLYLAAWAVIPSDDRDESIAVETLRDHRERPWLMLTLGLVAVGVLFTLSEVDFWPGSGNLWLAATLVGGALIWAYVIDRTGDRPTPAPQAVEATTEQIAGRQTVGVPSPRRPRKQSLFPPVAGALLVAAGFFGLLAVLDVYDVDVPVLLAAAVVVVGAGVVAGFQLGRRVGGLIVLGLVLLAAFGIAATSPVSISSGIGDKVERPLAGTLPERTYELGIGDLTVDLSDATIPAGRTQVDVRLGIGDAVITVPDDVALEIDARAGVGRVELLGKEEDGADAEESVSVPGPTPAAPVLELDADVAIGNLEIERE
ncbi:MAG TPA: PspC domain-containing protein [Gaiellaceae bacterium]|nr:PspC domain-containing protein [Gaiellaceae bacterium]